MNLGIADYGRSPGPVRTLCARFTLRRDSGGGTRLVKAQKKFAAALKVLAVNGDPRPLLIEHLGFDHVQQQAVDSSRWPAEWSESVVDVRFVAEKSGFRV